jgi:hypothetical protein
MTGTHVLVTFQPRSEKEFMFLKTCIFSEILFLCTRIEGREGVYGSCNHRWNYLFRKFRRIVAFQSRRIDYKISMKKSGV